MDGLDANGRVVGAVVACGDELGAAEGGLAIEDGVVADGYFDGDGVLYVKLGGVSGG